METIMNEEQAAARLAALGNATRIRLFRLLVRAGRGGLNVGDIQRRLDVPASTLAHHIAALVKADLVARERNGREIICIANYAGMDAIVAYLSEECCQGVAPCADVA
jgi:ArsR family transcriptional regulator, arsenate/arsenite/antimonite-responsive transcriptional repressor